MAVNQLTAVKVNQLAKPGRYSDGGGLYLYIKDNGAKFWEFRFQLNKRRRIMGLGSYDKKLNSLSAARQKATEKRALLLQGIDPIDNERTKKKSQVAITLTFKACADRYIKNKSAEWKSDKHKQQWSNTLRDYVYPFIGNKDVSEIDVTDIRAVLDPIWLIITETATRVRQRIEAVINSAIASGERTHPNPATWKGLLENFYPNPIKVKKKKYIDAGIDGHHAAISYEEIPKFMAQLVKRDGYAAMALRFLILTVPRTTELRLAEWTEIDFVKKTWIVPEGRMKAGVRHRIPLSDAAMDLLNKMPRIDNYIFPGWKKGSPLSQNAMLDVMQKKMKYRQYTVHGLRSTFRDYIGEETGFPERLAEFALAHQISDEAEKAYARGDKLKKRFEMMNAWATYVDSEINYETITPARRSSRS